MSAPRLPWEVPSSHAPYGGESERADLDAAQAAMNDRPHREDFITDDQIESASEAVQSAAEVALRAKLEGKGVLVTTTSVSGQQIKLTDAKNRAMRTLLQNLAVDIMVGLGTVLPMLVNMDFTDKVAWVAFGTSVSKTVIAVFVSYISRLTAEPVLPTPMETTGGQVVQPLPSAGKYAEG